MRPRGPVLALDYGSKRIGLAVSDADGTFAFPAGILERKGGTSDLDSLRELAAEREITRIVVGLPLHMDGRRGPEAEAAQKFASKLGEATGLPVDLLDERWTTLEAKRALEETAPRRRRKKPSKKPRNKDRERVDDAAATILLRTFLEQTR